MEVGFRCGTDGERGRRGVPTRRSLLQAEATVLVERLLSTSGIPAQRAHKCMIIIEFRLIASRRRALLIISATNAKHAQ